MLILLSPAKSLDFETPSPIQQHTIAELIQEASILMESLKTLSIDALMDLMGISEKLAALNCKRHTQWADQVERKQGKQALLAFSGRVYEGIQAHLLSRAELEYAQDHIRLLSGLYGVLRPLDLIVPYRLEMGTPFANTRGKDLYAFWKDKISLTLNATLKTHTTRTIINLASQEYFKAIQPALLDAPIITPVFQELKNTGYKIIGVSAKYARGLMTRFAITHAINNPEALKDFNAEGYTFTPEVSTASTWFFRR